VSVYKRGDVWWYEFCFCGSRVRESSKSTSRTVAREAERARRRSLEEAFNRIKKPRTAHLFSVAAEDWLASKIAHLATRTVKIERANLRHLNPFFGKMLVCDISSDNIGCYQGARLKEGASPKTINLEVATLRAVLRKHRLWATIQPDVRMLRLSEDVGRAITRDEEAALLAACQSSRSRSLYTAVVLALNTCMRHSELRLLKWKQVNFVARTITVGASKTEAGEGRVLPLNDRAFAVLEFWGSLFPSHETEHYVFPQEKYGLEQRKDADKGTIRPCVYSTDPRKPIGRWKKAWESAKKLAGVSCRFHDLRHTACTRMLEAGIPFSVVASIMGWSASTTVRMAKRYGHIGQDAQRQAVAALGGSSVEVHHPQNPPQSRHITTRNLAN